ncbi:DNA ligase [Azohydromonas aeria]|uniref:DNA ligase n=1 Tax=Azohydromonas aeria TaxID=2590212 RepID=UPI0012FC939C|nr:DNA ligase [Azohydromonas aeria]
MDPHGSAITRRRLLLLLQLGWLPSGTAVAAPGAPARLEPPALLLAREAPADLDPAGWLVSEKLDGVRALWDGERLRFRSGAPVPAPAAFLRRLPPQPLDGELWLARGRFSELSGLVRRQGASAADWARVRYELFELPGAPGSFEARARALAGLVEGLDAPALRAVPQERLPDRAALQRRLREVVDAGGEGLMLHRADAPYLTGRGEVLLKLKPQQDAEGLVVERRFGTEGRMQGLLVALRLRLLEGEGEGREFLLGSGFSDALRRDPPPLGSVVTYRHRGWSSRGLPRFASFLRVDPGV